MQYTITIRLAGCATRCWHCYVDGGPCEDMTSTEYHRALDLLEPVFQGLQADGTTDSTDLYLGMEPLMHPEVAELIPETKERFGDVFDIEGMPMPTSGYPLSARGDWREVLDAVKGVGCREMMLTLHGPTDLQDRAQGRDGMLEHHRRAVGRLHEQGFSTALNLMVSRDMLHRLDETLEIIHEMGYDSTNVRIPDFTPIPRMRRFEDHRATLADITGTLDEIRALASHDREYWNAPEMHTEEFVFNDVMSHPDRFDSFREIEDSLPRWMFLTVVPRLDLVYGNEGIHHHTIGNLVNDSTDVILGRIRTLPANYQFGMFFDVDALPSPAEIAESVADPNSQRLYRTTEDVLLLWADRFVNRSAWR
jgi:MoaA/NifB/PqqE/SkfB family radical SAM enzyme